MSFTRTYLEQVTALAVVLSRLHEPAVNFLKIRDAARSQLYSKIRMAAAIVVVQSPRLSPMADCVTFAVRTILLEMR
jgi:hypothetical protein